jgi:hypothetical protein
MMHGWLCRCGGVKQWLVRLWPSSPPLGGPDHCFTILWALSRRPTGCELGWRKLPAWCTVDFADVESWNSGWLDSGPPLPPWEVQTTISLLSTVKEAQQMWAWLSFFRNSGRVLWFLSPAPPPRREDHQPLYSHFVTKECCLAKFVVWCAPLWRCNSPRRCQCGKKFFYWTVWEYQPQ